MNLEMLKVHKSKLPNYISSDKRRSTAFNFHCWNFQPNNQTIGSLFQASLTLDAFFIFYLIHFELPLDIFPGKVWNMTAVKI